MTPAPTQEVATWVRTVGREFLDARDKLIAAEEGSWRRRCAAARPPTEVITDEPPQLPRTTTAEQPPIGAAEMPTPSLRPALLQRPSVMIAACAAVGLVLARPSSQARLLTELIRHRLTDLTVRRPIAALSVTVDESCADDGRQLNLGDAPAGEAALEVVLSRLQSALGEEALFGAELLDSHRPEGAWKDRRFTVASAPARALGWWESAQTAKAQAAAPPAKAVESYLLERPARLLRAPAALPAELSAEGTLRALELLGRKRRVTAVFGPERLTGEWWTEQPYARDYYRVVLEGVGPLWVFRDGRDGRFYAQGVFD
jgi:protein ImuB